MAATWIRPLHVNKGKSIAKTLSLRTDYAMNPDKTDGGSLVISYGCDPRTVDAICCKGRFLRTPTKSIAARPSVAV